MKIKWNKKTDQTFRCNFGRCKIKEIELYEPTPNWDLTDVKRIVVQSGYSQPWEEVKPKKKTHTINIENCFNVYDVIAENGSILEVKDDFDAEELDLAYILYQVAVIKEFGSSIDVETWCSNENERRGLYDDNFQSFCDEQEEKEENEKEEQRKTNREFINAGLNPKDTLKEFYDDIGSKAYYYEDCSERERDLEESVFQWMEVVKFRSQRPCGCKGNRHKKGCWFDG